MSTKRAVTTGDHYCKPQVNDVIVIHKGKQMKYKKLAVRSKHTIHQGSGKVYGRKIHRQQWFMQP